MSKEESKQILEVGDEFSKITVMARDYSDATQTEYKPYVLEGTFILAAQPGPSDPADMPAGWMEEVGGGPGCSPGAQGFLEEKENLKALGFDKIIMLNSKPCEEQARAVIAKKLPMLFASEPFLALKDKLGLKPLRHRGKEYYGRQTIVVFLGMVVGIINGETDKKGQDSVAHAKQHTAEVIEFIKKFVADIKAEIARQINSRKNNSGLTNGQATFKSVKDGSSKKKSSVIAESVPDTEISREVFFV